MKKCFKSRLLVNQRLALSYTVCDGEEDNMGSGGMAMRVLLLYPRLLGVSFLWPHFPKAQGIGGSEVQSSALC